jgi:hypothetical protein
MKSVLLTALLSLNFTTRQAAIDLAVTGGNRFFLMA